MTGLGYLYMTYEWGRKFQSHILSRGWNYAMDGMVSGIKRDGDTITAVVEGTEYYRVEIDYDGQVVQEAYCSCPYAAEGNWCKHKLMIKRISKTSCFISTNK